MLFFQSLETICAVCGSPQGQEGTRIDIWLHPKHNHSGVPKEAFIKSLEIGADASKFPPRTSPVYGMFYYTLGTALYWLGVRFLWSRWANPFWLSRVFYPAPLYRIVMVASSSAIHVGWTMPRNLMEKGVFDSNWLLVEMASPGEHASRMGTSVGFSIIRG